jgi:ADP-ribosylglycohydrolase
MSFNDRCAAAFLGLALGDAYGRPLEFTSGSSVRTQPVEIAPGAFRWTDDTHMSWYLAQALLLQGPDALDEDAFGQAVGERFAAWQDDPLTPSTAPGNTCMAGVRRWRQSRDWRSSGVPTSDGCGAVMRVAPLAMALAGEDLTRAAEIQAGLTHGHANAREAAIAASHLLRWTLERGRFGADLVERAVAGLRGDWGRGGVVAQALEAALEQGARRGEWLDEAAIPSGDGGWRAASALGLAVAAALRWGGDFATAVEKAARIHGDSDSVACLAGMLLGAAGGLEVLPARWLAALPWRGRLEGMARTLAARGRPVVAVADLHGHVGHLEALLRRLDGELADYTLVTLGDYCDNGPDVPGLLDRLIALSEARGADFVPILGNHDLACLRAMDDEAWYKRWASRYWNPGGATPAAYGASSGAELRRRMPGRHQRFLEGLPWFARTERYLFVHAGMQEGPLAPQLQPLAAQILPEERLHLPPAIREKGLAKVADPRWEQVVVSAHTKGWALGGPRFVGPNRICLAGEVDETGKLHAVVLPERRYLSIAQEDAR